MYRDLGFQRLDAVLLDHPIALYVAKPLPDVKFVGAPIGRLDYGMALPKKNVVLRDKLNGALARLEANGQLRLLWERWGLWNPVLAGSVRAAEAQSEPVALQAYLASRSGKETWQERAQRYAFKFTPLLAKGAAVTLELSVLGMALAMTLGLALSLARLYGP
jgi:polar amino acid transport system substrate-binding protein